MTSRKMPESELQSLLEIHPYLIEPEFLNVSIESQKYLESGRADIVVYLTHEIVVVELKVTPLINRDVLQLNGYLEDIQKQTIDKTVRGILIGEEPKNEISKLLEILHFPIQVKMLKKDIPIEIKICKNCRCANDIKNVYCIYCNTVSWL